MGVQTTEEKMCEDATGCDNAGDFREFAENAGYPYCHVLDWTSSAGDWSFIVSEDGLEWYLMYQVNRYPKRGFDRTIDTSQCFPGNSNEVLTEVWNMFEIGPL